jgi:hypothetical protein
MSITRAGTGGKKSFIFPRLRRPAGRTPAAAVRALHQQQAVLIIQNQDCRTNHENGRMADMLAEGLEIATSAYGLLATTSNS